MSERNPQYVVQAAISYTDAEGWAGTYATPTFILSAHVQGITDEAHAERIALDVVDPTKVLRKSGATITITAIKV